MRVFTIPASVPFLRTLVTALVDGRLVEGFSARAEPTRLASATLYLPTSRASRMVREIFLDVLDTDAVELPRIFMLGDIDEDEIGFAEDPGQFGPTPFDIPPTLGKLERQFVLARLVAQWAKSPTASPQVIGGPASTLALANDLARLMDDMVTRGVGWNALDGIVPDNLDRYWQMTLDFLKIAKELWPTYLQAANRIEPAARQNLLITAEAQRLKAHQAGPVIIAGSTGSMPTTAKFIRIVAGLPQGAVVLPGLDTDLDDAAWDLIGGTKEAQGKQTTPPSSNHPQSALHGLLDTFGIKRRDVEILGAPSGRELLASELMRPSNATAQWHKRLAEPAVVAAISAGMKNLTVIAAANPEIEALAIAVAMRESQELGISAALVTPDRALARRVMAALGRWNLEYDDSGGDALMDTPHGIFARLAAAAAAEGLEPATLLALLKHPLLRLGRAAGEWSRAIQTLEIALLRGTRPEARSVGLAKDFARFRAELIESRAGRASTLHASELRAKLQDDRLDEVQQLIDQLHDALKPLESVDGFKPHDFVDLAQQHRKIIKALSFDPTKRTDALTEKDGKALANAFDELLVIESVETEDSGKQDKLRLSGLMVSLQDYPEVYHTAFEGRPVRGGEMLGARLRIYGNLESRLTQSDRVIIGGLVEGIWPPSPRIDPWLSRPMRHDLELDLPERRIGLSAHDFTQLLGTEDVILSHAAKVGGAPAVASRFLHRLEAVAGKQHWDAAVAAGEKYIRYADELDRPATVTPITQPAPKPPRDARPTKLSVTAIEDWLRDPYTIYAKYILRLSPLDPVDMPLSAADRGSAIHNALGDFTQAFATTLPDHPARALREIGSKHFLPLMTRPEAQALWWPRFLRIADWFANWEIERRLNVSGIIAEQQGKIEIPLDSGRIFHLSARADRIERRADRTFAILDYKTGQPPTGKQVRMGLSPQLTLEAAILREGGFENIPAGSIVSELTYVRLSGNNPPGEERVLELRIERKDEAQFPDDAAIEARAKLEALILKFEDETTPYNSLSLSMWSNRYGRYDDLARIKEWSAAGDAGADS